MHYFPVSANCVSKNSTQQIIPQLWQLDYMITIEDPFYLQKLHFFTKTSFSQQKFMKDKSTSILTFNLFFIQILSFLSNIFFCHSMQNSSISIFSASKRSLSGLAFGEQYFRCIRLFFRFDNFYPFYAMCYGVKCAKKDCFLSFGRKKSTEMIAWKFSNSFGLFWDLCFKCASFFCSLNFSFLPNS